MKVTLMIDSYDNRLSMRNVKRDIESMAQYAPPAKTMTSKKHISQSITHVHHPVSSFILWLSNIYEFNIITTKSQYNEKFIEFTPCFQCF